MDFTLSVIYDHDEEEFVLSLKVPSEGIVFEVPMSRHEVWVWGKTLVAVSSASLEPGEN